MSQKSLFVRAVVVLAIPLGLAACSGDGLIAREAPLAEDIGVAEREVLGLGQGECFAIEDGECVGVTGGAAIPVPAEDPVGTTQEGIGIFR